MVESSRRAIADVLGQYETVTPRDGVESADDLTLAFTLESAARGETVEVWETREGAHYCRTSRACYRLPAGVAPLLLLYPLVEADDWTLTDSDSPDEESTGRDP